MPTVKRLRIDKAVDLRSHHRGRTTLELWNDEPVPNSSPAFERQHAYSSPDERAETLRMTDRIEVTP